MENSGQCLPCPHPACSLVSPDWDLETPLALFPRSPGLRAGASATPRPNPVSTVGIKQDEHLDAAAAAPESSHGSVQEQGGQRTRDAQQKHPSAPLPAQPPAPGCLDSDLQATESTDLRPSMCQAQCQAYIISDSSSPFLPVGRPIKLSGGWGWKEPWSSPYK